jgi:hypothetical protein
MTGWELLGVAGFVMTGVGLCLLAVCACGGRADDLMQTNACGLVSGPVQPVDRLLDDDADRLVLIKRAREREDREVALLDNLWALPARTPLRHFDGTGETA